MIYRDTPVIPSLFFKQVFSPLSLSSTQFFLTSWGVIGVLLVDQWARVSKKPATHGPSPFLDGAGHRPQFRPDPTRQVGPPVGPPLKKYIYINIQEIENATLIKIFIANYFIHWMYTLHLKMWEKFTSLQNKYIPTRLAPTYLSIICTFQPQK